jgi:hypothetical protein
MADRSPINLVLAALDQVDCRTTESLAAATGLSGHDVSMAAGKLIARGLADRAERGCYTLTPEGAAHQASGKPILPGPRGPRNSPTPRRQANTLRTRLWAAMRIRGKFTIGDLLDLAAQGDGSYSGAQKYVTALARAGYLRQLPIREQGTAPTSNGHRRWTLIDNTGPAAPVVRPARGEVWDPNTQTARPLGGRP